MTGSDGRAVQALALQQLGIMAAHIRANPQDADVPGAEALFERAQALWQALGDQRHANARLRNRAHTSRLAEPVDVGARCLFNVLL